MILEHHGFAVEDSPYTKYHICELDWSTGDIISENTLCGKSTEFMTSVGKEADDGLVCNKCRNNYDSKLEAANKLFKFKYGLD